MIPPIVARLARCRNERVLVTLESHPFNGTAMRIEELRLLAKHLLSLATLAESTPERGKYSTLREVVVDDNSCWTARTRSL